MRDRSAVRSGASGLLDGSHARPGRVDGERRHSHSHAQACGAAESRRRTGRRRVGGAAAARQVGSGRRVVATAPSGHSRRGLDPGSGPWRDLPSRRQIISRALGAWDGKRPLAQARDLLSQELLVELERRQARHQLRLPQRILVCGRHGGLARRGASHCGGRPAGCSRETSRTRHTGRPHPECSDRRWP